jgi:hypothetical protein
MTLRCEFMPLRRVGPDRRRTLPGAVSDMSDVEVRAWSRPESGITKEPVSV